MIAAGSLLGTLLAKPKSYPVGMVNLLDIFPLGFDEFLNATDPFLFAYYDGIQKEQQIEEIFHNRLLEAYHYYLIIGGMPECVALWVKYKDPAKVSQLQRELIEVYENGLYQQVCLTVFTIINLKVRLQRTMFYSNCEVSSM